MPEGYKEIPYKGILIKRRKIGHLVEDEGCGHEWYTYEIPEDYVSGLEVARKEVSDERRNS